MNKEIRIFFLIIILVLLILIIRKDKEYFTETLCPTDKCKRIRDEECEKSKMGSACCQGKNKGNNPYCAKTFNDNRDVVLKEREARNASNSSNSSNSGLSTIVIIGIVVGVVLFISIVAGVLIYLNFKRRADSKNITISS